MQLLIGLIGLFVLIVRRSTSAIPLAMRLLFHDADDDEYKLDEFNEKDVPPYAILSHTWLAEEEEPNPNEEAEDEVAEGERVGRMVGKRVG